MRTGDAADGSTGGSARRSLFKKYFLALFVAVLVPVLANSASEAWFSYRDRRAMIEALLIAQASSAADRIQGFLDGLVAQLRWATHLSSNVETRDRWLLDALRVLRQTPAITEISHLDAAGREQMRVSRLALDVVASGVDRSGERAFSEAAERGVYLGQVYFRNKSEPYLTLALASGRRSAGVVVAEVNLKLIWDVISTIRVGEAGLAYAVDHRGRLIAHPDVSRVLRGDGSLSAARATMLAGFGSASPVRLEDDGGRSVIVAMAPVDRVGWFVLVEQPLSEAFAPIYAAFLRTGVLLLTGAALAAVLAYLLARRMSGPIRQLEEGASRIGSGKFDHRIQIETGDELERLADRFNTMAAELGISQDRAQRIARLRQFLAPQVADLVERVGQEAVLEGQRVDVVAIFCDLRNFTSFSGQADPDEVMGVLERYYSALGPIISKFEATQTSFTGDGLMLLLNAPLPCAHAAARAIEMAIEMQAAVQALLLEWRARGYDIGYGMGMAEGPATVGRIGYETRLEYTAIGTVVNLASRLCSSAADGEILIDAAMAEKVGGAALVRDLGLRTLKGFDKQVPVFGVQGLEGASEPRQSAGRKGAA